MGLLASSLHVLGIEQKEHPIRGDVLTISQQAVYGTLNEVKEIFGSHGVLLKELPAGFDVKNKIPNYIGSPKENFTNAAAVLKLLGADKIFVTDITDHEGADFLIDLNYPVDPKYYEKFDYILDSGTLEHVFDAPLALGNLAKMAKKGGRIGLILPCSNSINHGFFSFNPNLFYDFFAANGFSDMTCYLVEGSSFNVYKKSKIYKYDYSPGMEYPLYSKHMIDICFFATKKENATSSEIKKPIQGMYLISDWGRKEEKNINKKSSLDENIEKIKRKLEWETRKYRPEIIDILWKTKRRKTNLTYLGKF